jgi:tRNA modification GTPase
VATKCDQGGARKGAHATSAHTGEGLPELRGAIVARLAALQRESDPLAHTGARCRDSLLEAGACLLRAAESVQQGGADELIAIDLREALEALGRVVGTVVTDDILDRIFQRFCIGK